MKTATNTMNNSCTNVIEPSTKPKSCRPGWPAYHWLGAGVLLTAVLVNCTGTQTPAKQPDPGMPTAPPGQSQAIMTPGGAQYAVTDTPSSSAIPVAERPKMNESAKQPYMQALEAFGRGELLQAKQFFEQAISLDSRAYQAHYSLGVILERLRSKEALTQYRRSFSIVPDYEPAITSYGVALAREGRLQEADQFLTERQAKMPKSAAVAASLAEVKSMQRDTASAQKLAQYALKENPNYAPAMVILARDHYRNRRLDLAKYALQAILDGFGPDNPPRDSGNAEAKLLRSLILKEEGNRAGAIAELEVVMQRRPDLVDAGVQLATYYLESGNAQKAQPLLEKALQYNSQDLVAHMNLGDAHRLSGRPEQAKREFEWVLSKDPSQIQAHYNLGLLYLFSDNFPGMTAMQQVNAALASLEKYKELRGRSVSTQGSDFEQLILRARAKKAMIEAEAKAAQPAQVPPAAGSAAPRASGSAAPAQPAASQPPPAAAGGK